MHYGTNVSFNIECSIKITDGTNIRRKKFTRSSETAIKNSRVYNDVVHNSKNIKTNYAAYLITSVTPSEVKRKN